MMIDPGRFTHLTFDCYGTLIDWETGILDAVRPVLERHGVELENRRLLTLFGRFEAAEEAGDYRSYREVLRGVMTAFGDELGFAPAETDLQALPDSVAHWPAFEDSVAALGRLSKRFRLAILSNIDDDMFAGSARILGVSFAEVVTAQQIGSYKPARRHFDVALERLAVTRERVLHVAQSLFHDLVPAQEIGLACVWVNRRSRVPGFGATPPAEAAPDAELPDLASLADLLDC